MVHLELSIRKTGGTVWDPGQQTLQLLELKTPKSKLNSVATCEVNDMGLRLYSITLKVLHFCFSFLV